MIWAESICCPQTMNGSRSSGGAPVTILQGSPHPSRIASMIRPVLTSRSWRHAEIEHASQPCQAVVARYAPSLDRAPMLEQIQRIKLAKTLPLGIAGLLFDNDRWARISDRLLAAADNREI